MTRISRSNNTLPISGAQETNRTSENSNANNLETGSGPAPVQPNPATRQSRLQEVTIQGQARQTQLQSQTTSPASGIQNRFSDWVSQRSREILQIGHQFTNTASRIANSVSPEITTALRSTGSSTQSSAQSLRQHSNVSNYLHSDRSLREIGETLVRTGEQAMDATRRGLQELSEPSSRTSQYAGANVIQRDIQPHVDREARLGRGLIQEGRDIADGLQRRFQEQTAPLRAAAERQVQILQNTARSANDVLNDAGSQAQQIGSDVLDRSVQNVQHAINDASQTAQNTATRGIDIAQTSVNRAINTAREVVSGNQTTEGAIQDLRQISRDATQQGVAAVEDAANRMNEIANDASQRQTQIGLDAASRLVQTADSTVAELNQVAANGMRQSVQSVGQAVVEQVAVHRNAVAETLETARSAGERLVGLGREIAVAAVPALDVDRQIREMQDGESIRLSASGSAGVVLGGQLQGEVSISREDQVDPQRNRTPQYNIEYTGELGLNARAELGEQLSLGRNDGTGLDGQINYQALGGGRFTFSFTNSDDARRAGEILQTPDVLRTREHNRFLMDHARTLEFNYGAQLSGAGTGGLQNGRYQIDGIQLQGGVGAREGVRIELPRPDTQDPIRVSRFYEGIGSGDASLQLSLGQQRSNDNQRDSGGIQLSTGQTQTRIRIERTVDFPQGTSLSDLLRAANENPIFASPRGQITVSATGEMRGGLIAGPGRRETNRITLQGPAENMYEATAHLIRGEVDEAIRTAGPGVTVQARQEQFQNDGFTFAPSISVNGVNASVNVTAERSRRLSRTDTEPVPVETLAREVLDRLRRLPDAIPPDPQWP